MHRKREKKEPNADDLSLFTLAVDVSSRSDQRRVMKQNGQQVINITYDVHHKALFT